MDDVTQVREMQTGETQVHETRLHETQIHETQAPETERHRLDAFSLLAGILLLMIGVWALVEPEVSWDVDPRWLMAGLLIALGVVGLLRSVESLQRRDDSR